MTGPSRHYVLAAGGTGGHLTPAFALAHALERRGHHVALITDARGDALGPAERVLAEAARGQHVRRQEVGLAGDLGPPAVGDQRDVMPAPFEFVRQREGGRQVPAGAARGENEMARRSIHRSFSRRSSAPARPKPSRLRNGLRRVSASSRPTVRHCAMVDEPP